MPSVGGRQRRVGRGRNGQRRGAGLEDRASRRRPRTDRRLLGRPDDNRIGDGRGRQLKGIRHRRRAVVQHQVQGAAPQFGLRVVVRIAERADRGHAQGALVQCHAADEEIVRIRKNRPALPPLLETPLADLAGERQFAAGNDRRLHGVDGRDGNRRQPLFGRCRRQGLLMRNGLAHRHAELDAALRRLARLAEEPAPRHRHDIESGVLPGLPRGVGGSLCAEDDMGDVLRRQVRRRENRIHQHQFAGDIDRLRIIELDCARRPRRTENKSLEPRRRHVHDLRAVRDDERGCEPRRVRECRRHARDRDRRHGRVR